MIVSVSQLVQSSSPVHLSSTVIVGICVSSHSLNTSYTLCVLEMGVTKESLCKPKRYQ